MIYFARKQNCGALCAQDQVLPEQFLHAKIARSVHEAARDRARGDRQDGGLVPYIVSRTKERSEDALRSS